MDARLPTSCAPTTSYIDAPSPFPAESYVGIPTMGNTVAHAIPPTEAQARRKRRSTMEKDEAEDEAEQEEEEVDATELDEGVDTPQTDLPSPCRGVVLGIHLRSAAGR